MSPCSFDCDDMIIRMWRHDCLNVTSWAFECDVMIVWMWRHHSNLTSWSFDMTSWLSECDVMVMRNWRYDFLTATSLSFDYDGRSFVTTWSFELDWSNMTSHTPMRRDDTSVGADVTLQVDCRPILVVSIDTGGNFWNAGIGKLTEQYRPRTVVY